jgi:hypothetical protein
VSKAHRFLLVFAALATITGNAFAWSCKTHTFIADVAGMKNPEYACIPDAARYDNYNLLGQFHYHNAAPGTKVTAEYIEKFAVEKKEYVPKDKPDSKPVSIMVPNESGVLYWKIIELYKELKATKYSSTYNWDRMSIAHFIGDLSQPLHNYPSGDEPASDGRVYSSVGAWSKASHASFDERFDKLAPRALDIPEIKIDSENDLRKEVSKIANASIDLANLCYKEQGRMMKDDEVTSQVVSSIALLRAVLKNTERNDFSE